MNAASAVERNAASPASETARPVTRSDDTRIAAGFVASPSASVVRIYWNCTDPSNGSTCSRCSGSMIATGLVLTAGHCVYSNYRDGDVGDKTGFVGYYDASTYFVIPGNTLVNGTPTAPYGVWTVRHMWTTASYGTDDLLGGDWGLIELNRNAQGQYPGDVGIGAFTASWDEPTIGQLYSIGYPTDGFFSASLTNGLGNYQYFCDDNWNPATDSETDATNFGSYYGLVVQPCEETGGASGGPVFTDANGSWTIVGVNNRAPSPNDQGLSSYMLSFYFNDSFGAFWQDVVNQINAGV